VLDVGGAMEVSLHVKLPGDLSLGQAHDIAEEVDVDRRVIEEAVRAETGAAPRELRFVRTDEGLVVFLTLGLGGEGSLADAHGAASAIEERVRGAVPAIADVVVHTEP
jgi:divalent metal cation (Fe/Co/Zn/Cd) transporter